MFFNQDYFYTAVLLWTKELPCEREDLDLALLTLHLPWTLIIAIVLGVPRGGAALSKVLDIRKLQVSLLDVLIIQIVLHLHRGVGQSLLQCGNRRLVELTILRELHTEENIQISLDEGVAVAGHALVGNNLHEGLATDSLGLDDFSGLALDHHLPSVQMLHNPLEAAKGLVQAEGLGHEEVGTLPLEGVVLLLLHDEVDIAGFHVGLLVGHAAEGDLLVVAHPLVDVNLQDLALLLAAALVPLTGTGAAGTLELLDHAEGDLTELHDGTLPVAFFAHGGLADEDLAVDGQLDGLAVVQVLEADLEGVVHVVSLAGSGRPPPGSPAEEHAEQIVAAGSSAALFGHALEAVLVVLGALLGVAEDLVRGRDLLELGLIAALIGMVLHGELPVGLFDFLGVGRLFDLFQG